jgi:hypothetical protein
MGQRRQPEHAAAIINQVAQALRVCVKAGWALCSDLNAVRNLASETSVKGFSSATPVLAGIVSTSSRPISELVFHRLSGC